MRVGVCHVYFFMHPSPPKKKKKKAKGKEGRRTAVVGDEDLASEAGAAAGQHVVLKLDLRGSHCERREREGRCA